MPRRLRFAPSGYCLHLTPCGNNKQSVFSTDVDRQHFLSLVEQDSEDRVVWVAAYTLMSNHFHLVAVGDRQDTISHFMMEVNGQYAVTAMLPNALLAGSGRTASTRASSMTPTGKPLSVTSN